MPKPNMHPSLYLDPPDPLELTAREIAAFIEQQSPGGIERAFCKESGDGLIIAVESDMVERFRLCRLGGECDPASSVSILGDLFTARELLSRNIPPPRPLIEGLLHESETVVIAGRQKVGKSRLVLQMAKSLVIGEPFLGMRVSSPARVLMIDLENRPAPLSQRLRTMGGSRAGDGQLFVWCAQSLDSKLPDASKDGCQRLRELVAQVAPDVLVIDPWRLWLGGDENSAPDIVRGLQTLASIRAGLPQLAIVIVHHVRKERFESPRRLLQDPSLWADAVSGHHALSAHVDACFGLERQPDDDDNPLIVFGGIARNTEPHTLILDEDETLRFHVAAGEDVARRIMSAAQEQIWEAIRGVNRFTFTEALERAKTKNKKALSTVLSTAVRHGLLIHDGKRYARTAA